MGYNVDSSPSAKIQIAEAIEYYSEISDVLPWDFMDELDSSYEHLKTNPYYQKRYKNVRGLPVKKFPYLLLFIIDENNKIVKILSCFHTSQNPKKYSKPY